MFAFTLSVAQEVLISSIAGTSKNDELQENTHKHKHSIYLYFEHFHFIRKQIESHSFYSYMTYSKSNLKIMQERQRGLTPNPFEWWIWWTVPSSHFSSLVHFFFYHHFIRSFSFKILIAFCVFQRSPFFRALYLSVPIAWIPFDVYTWIKKERGEHKWKTHFLFSIFLFCLIRSSHCPVALGTHRVHRSLLEFHVIIIVEQLWECKQNLVTDNE